MGKGLSRVAVGRDPMTPWAFRSTKRCCQFETRRGQRVVMVSFGYRYGLEMLLSVASINMYIDFQQRSSMANEVLVYRSVTVRDVLDSLQMEGKDS